MGDSGTSHNKRDMKIDSVLTTQPELGPHIPDGGYGWLVLIATSFFQLVMPSIVIAYGIFMLFLRLEIIGGDYPILWDNPLVYASLFFVATWTFTDPWSRSVIANSIWPRLVATAGTCITCAGLLLIWFAISTGSTNTAWFVVSGMLSGFGSSIVISQCEVLILQYFKVKLKHVNTLTQIAVAVGFILVPIILGTYIIQTGLLTVIVWYQVVILQGLIVCLLIRKPKYLKAPGRQYRRVQLRESMDDEVDVFAKNSTELQNTRSNLTPNDTTTADKYNTEIVTDLGNRNDFEPISGAENANASNLIDIEIHSTQNPREEWMTFDEDEIKTSKEKTVTQKNLQKSFKVTAADMEKIDTFEDSFVPKQLFTETSVNNNNTYSFDNSDLDSEPVVFTRATDNVTIRRSRFYKEIDFMKQPTFYKSLLQIITTKFSIFTFFTLFPSFVYMRLEYLKIHEVGAFMSYTNMGSLIFILFFIFVGSNTPKRALYMWVFSWLGALGFILISDVKSEYWFIIGGILVIISIQSLQYFGEPLLQLTLRGETTKAHSILSAVTGIAFLLFFIINFSYVNCFRFMALLQFIMGGTWFSNFLLKKMKPVFESRM